MDKRITGWILAIVGALMLLYVEFSLLMAIFTSKTLSLWQFLWWAFVAVSGWRLFR